VASKTQETGIKAGRNTDVVETILIARGNEGDESKLPLAKLVRRKRI